MGASVQKPSGIKACFAVACSDKPTKGNRFAPEFLVTPPKAATLLKEPGGDSEMGLSPLLSSSKIHIQPFWCCWAESITPFSRKVLVLSDTPG